jgi:hypothetical protein
VPTRGRHGSLAGPSGTLLRGIIGIFRCAMIAVAFGFINPVQGALLQEAIDVAVILNALRVLRDPLSDESQRNFEAAELVRTLITTTGADRHALKD